MSRKAITAVLDATEIPSAHMAWPVNAAPPLPWMVFRLDEDGKLNADNARWASHGRWVVELYQKHADSEIEGKVESAISEAFGDYDKTEIWVDSEDCLMTSYRFTVIERNDSNG